MKNVSAIVTMIAILGILLFILTGCGNSDNMNAENTKNNVEAVGDLENNINNTYNEIGDCIFKSFSPIVDNKWIQRL